MLLAFLGKSYGLAVYLLAVLAILAILAVYLLAVTLAIYFGHLWLF